jgi:hypothetical protein
LISDIIALFVTKKSFFLRAKLFLPLKKLHYQERSTFGKQKFCFPLSEALFDTKKTLFIGKTVAV